MTEEMRNDHGHKPATPTADLEALIAKAKAATPGPWKQRAHQFDDWGWIRSGEGNLVAIARAGHAQPVLDEHRARGTDPYEHNAAYIAAASPDVVLSLCEEIKRLRASSVSPASDGVLRERLQIAEGFMDRVLDRKGVEGWTLQGSLYEHFSTEIWNDAAEPGKRTIAIVRDYHDAQKIMAALAKGASTDV